MPRDDWELYSYLTSAFTSLLIILAAWQLTPFVGTTSLYLLFILVIFLNAWLGGLKTGLITTIAGTLAGLYFFLVATDLNPTDYLSSIFELTLFALLGVLISSVIEKYKKTDLVNEYRKQNKLFIRKFEKLEDACNKMKAEIKMRDEFLSIASHELKNPLTTMLLKIERILHNIRNVSLANFSVENLLQMLETAEEQTKRLSRMINDLLNVSLITTGKLNLEKTDEDLTQIVQEIAVEFKEKLEKGHYAFRLDASSPILISLDRMRIAQVITNMLSNAIKYGEGRPIEVIVKKHGDTAKITVRDNGLGIPEDHHQKIFQLFERGLPQNGIKGLGVGLYISNQIVKSHGGTIKISSKPGAGSIFTIELPIPHHTG
jgi:signal transduction histidine kinase